MNLQTIQKVATNTGIHSDSIIRMIDDNKIHAYKQTDFKRILIDLDEFNLTFNAITNLNNHYDFDLFKV